MSKKCMVNSVENADTWFNEQEKKNVHPPAQCPQVCIPTPNESKAHGMREEILCLE